MRVQKEIKRTNMRKKANKNVEQRKEGKRMNNEEEEKEKKQRKSFLSIMILHFSHH
jgi:hypothetical protein